MGWDNSRPVPWQRLVREWLIYAAIMTAVFVIFFRGDNVVGAIAGVLISGPLYLAFGAVLAKFGYQRQRLKDIRAESRKKPAPADDDDTDAPNAGRPKPPPTSRTAGGGNRPKTSGKRKR
ncbi:MAG TPA: hypothetical protein VK860_10825 [Ilumatobacteraceae bacterium]|jgi:hypothetical protein|nr:hypothetical protein [Ilumatobacteraceae bacterium]